jgi:hypothetical protein
MIRTVIKSKTLLTRKNVACLYDMNSVAGNMIYASSGMTQMLVRYGSDTIIRKYFYSTIWSMLGLTLC